MPRAGFYTIQNSKIRFGCDGRWYADDEPIANQRIADLFSRHIQRAGDGRYVLRLGGEEASVEVEDTPYVVVGVTVGAEGTVTVELNDHTNEPLDLDTLEIGSNEVPYCRVKNAREWARFLRPAYYQLTPHITEVEPGHFVIRTAAATHRIGTR